MKKQVEKYEELSGKLNPGQVVYQSKPDKSVKKFHEDEDIDDWIEKVQSQLPKMENETEKVNYILNHLDKKPYTELRFRIDRTKATSKEVTTLLKEIYGCKKSFMQLQQCFFSRHQQSEESIDDFCISLMEMVIQMEKMKPAAMKKSDQLLKEVLAEGVRDISLRRELRRLNREQPTLQFYEVRDQAKSWTTDADTESAQEAISQETQISSLVTTIQEQQQELKKLSEAVFFQPQYRSRSRGRSRYRGRGRGDNSRGRGNSFRGRGDNTNGRWFNSRGRGRGQSSDTQGASYNYQETDTQATEEVEERKYEDPLICHYCRQPNHVQRDCVKRKRDARMHASNYSHLE